MHTTNYYDTLILVSPDCRAQEGTRPPKPGTIAALQHEWMLAAPYGMTSDDLIFSVHAERKAIPTAEREAAGAAFFSKGQPCMRSSPLVKSYGWGVHHDSAGRVAIFGAESARYRELVEDETVTKIRGVRSQRQPQDGVAS